MAGIIAYVSRNPVDAALNGAARLLCHGDMFDARCYVHTPQVGLASAFRTNDPPSSFWWPAEQLGVVVYGTAFQTGGTYQRVQAETVGGLYRAAGVGALGALDGAFVIAVFDGAQRMLHVVNDRTATLPMRFFAEAGRFVIAPEAKAIYAVLGRPPEWDMAGVLALLAAGHGLGHGTLFQGIRLMAPASVLSVALDSGALSQQQYWELRFRPRKRLREIQAAGELREVLLACHKSVLSDRPESVQLLMTGGFDSRTVLGLLTEVGTPPTECLTWGVSPSIPASDPMVARAICREWRVPWRFLRYDADTFAENVVRWAAISELDSDNLGNFAAGHDFLYRSGPVAPVMLIGDELLGTGGLPVGRADALESAIGVPYRRLAPGLADLLRPGVRATAAEMVWRNVDEALGDRAQEAPKDVQDYLGLHVRMTRWLNAPTYFREPMVSPRRPLLLQPALDFFQTLPGAFRVDKRVLVAMLRRHFPRLLAPPAAAANSLVDWTHAFTDSSAGAGRALRDLLADERLPGSPLGAYLDPDAFHRSCDAYFSQRVMPMERRPKAERVLRGLRRFMSQMPVAGRGVRWGERGYRRLAGRPVGASRGLVLARLGLLAALFRCVDQGCFRPRPETGPQPGAWPVPPAWGGERPARSMAEGSR